jgi:hypothetical protein
MQSRAMLDEGDISETRAAVGDEPFSRRASEDRPETNQGCRKALLLTKLFSRTGGPDEILEVGIAH